MKKTFIIPLLIVLFLAGNAPALTGISTCEELQNMKNDLSEDYCLRTDIDCSGTINWNGGMGFEPVGGNRPYFSGSLDGRGHKIIGLFINRPGQIMIGLFGRPMGVTIQNLGLVNVDITGSDYVGSFAGSNGGGTIKTSYVTGKINGGGGITGGITALGGSIVDCYSRVSVTSYYNGNAHNYVGGLVGENGHPIIHSYATGTVKGGLIGHSAALIGNSYGSTTYDFWDITTTGLTVGAGGYCPPCLHDTAGSFGKTTAEMKQRSTFTAWDFDAVWDIDGMTNNGYPFLRAPPITSMPPTVALTANNATGQEPLLVSFTGSCTDECDAITGCSLNFGDGTPAANFSSGTVNTTHNYTYRATPYTATLTGTNASGGSATATATITVSELPNQAPVASIDTPDSDITIIPGERIVFTGTGTDNDGSIAVREWKFGDGSGIADSAVEDPGNITFNNEGSFIVSFRVMDNDNEWSNTATRTITVEQSTASISLSLQPLSIAQGADFSDAGFTVVSGLPTVPVTVTLFDNVSGQAVKETSLAVSPGSVQDLRAWLSAPTLEKGSYRLNASAFNSGGNLIASDEVFITVVPGVRTAVPDFSILALPLLLAGVLFALRKK